MQVISCVVPCYNEEESITIFYSELSKVLNTINEYDYEIIFIDDGSKDRTVDRMKELATKDNKVKYLSFSRNFGKEAAMYAGLQHAKGELVAILDADMQDPPSLIPEMLTILKEKNVDSVATRRVTRKGEPPIRSFFAQLFYKIMNRISNVSIMDGARDFRLMKKSVVDAVVSMSENNRFSKGIFGWVGFETYWLSYDNVERIAGVTKWNFWKLFKYAIDGMVNFSDAPLQISTGCGLLFSIIALCATAFLFFRKLILGDPVQGWASLACIILFAAGVQLFCIGILGQYLAKVYLESKHRPQYILKESNIAP